MVMGSLRQETDLVVIGAGPGGYVAAIRAADLGREVVLVDERERPGGACLLEGCIPSKTLIHAVELVHAAAQAEALGLHFAAPSVDLARLRAHVAEVVAGLSTGVEALLRKRGVELVRGRASFDGPRSVAVEGADVAGLEFRHAIVATGSRPRLLPASVAPPGLELWTSTEALALPEVPERLLVVGGGYIGLELGLVYAGLGAEVSVVELNPRLLAGADPDLVEVMVRSVERRLAAIHADAKVVALERSSAGLVATIERGGERERLEASRVLVSVGRVPATAGLGLERAGVVVDRAGFVTVDDRCRTSAPQVFAIGDVVPGPALAHKASREAKVAAEVIAGLPAAFDNRAVPAVVFTDPEIAWTGLTEDEARARAIEVNVGRFPLRALGRARTLGRPDGLVKILSEPSTGLILGVGMVGASASELIGEATLALEMGATLEDLSATIHPHPTMSESLMEAAEVAAGAPVHVLPARRPVKEGAGR
jgi:dihydrolipoamide dehydrogenase